MRRRSVGDAWYTALYREPARHWWVTPLVGALGFALVDLVLSSWTAAVVGALGWLIVAVPLWRWRYHRDEVVRHHI